MDEPIFDLLLDGDLIKVFEAEYFAEGSFDQAADSASQLMSISTQQLVKCEGKENPRFSTLVPAGDLRAKQVEAIPRKTRNQDRWAVALWREWAKHRNGLPETVLEPGFPIPLDVAEISNFVMLEFWLQRFVVEICRKDGKPYPGDTLVQICSSIQRHLKGFDKFKDINIFKSDVATFADFRKTLDAKMKELAAMGIGVKKSSAYPVTVEDEAALWEKGVLNTNTSKGLSNAVFFYNGKTFGLRGFQEHVDCQADQYEFGYDYFKSVKYLKFHPRVRKNAQGGLKQRRINLDPIIHYEQEENERSVYKIFYKYLNLVPHKGPFYRKPSSGTDQKNNVRFSAGTIAQNTLKQMMKTMFKEADLDIEGRRISNHSWRVTLCTSFYNEKYTDKAVSGRSHHRSNAVHAYQRESFTTLKDISNILDSKPNRESIKVKGEECPRGPKVPSSCQVVSSSRTEMEPTSALTEMDECLTVHVPRCVKKIVVMKEGRRIVMDI